MFKKIVAVAMLFIAAQNTNAVVGQVGQQMITQQTLQWVIEEASIELNKTVSYLQEAYADGALVITEMPDPVLFKVSLNGGNPIIVSIEDRL